MNCIIVLGCWRSGTSAVAGVLHHLGVMMGEKFNVPTPMNPKGYFEDIEFKEVFNGLMNYDPACEDLMMKLIRKRRTNFKLWGVKDPQLCYLLDQFTEHLWCDHKLISTVRDKEAIAKSMARVVFKTEENFQQYLPLVEGELLQKKIQLEKYKGEVLEVKFEELNNCVDKISKFVGLPVTQEALDHVSMAV